MVKERGVRYLRYVLLFVSLLALLGSVGTTEASVYSSLIMGSQATVSSPEVILQNGTVGSSLIYTNSTSASVSVEAPLFDYVDNNDPDVDSSSDTGQHSNFSAQQAGPDSIYDMLEEENAEAIEDYVDNISDVDSSPDIGTHSSFNSMKSRDDTYDTLNETALAENEYCIDLTGGYITVATADLSIAQGTISFWIQFDAVTTGRPVGANGDLEFRLDGNVIDFDWGGDDLMTSSNTFTTATWYFFALTWDENADDLFFHVGTETSAPTQDANSQDGTYTGTVSTIPQGTVYWGNGYGASQPVNGHMDDIRFYDTVRTLSEILTDYNQTLDGDETGLVNYYELENDYIDSAGTDDGSLFGSGAFDTDVPSWEGGDDYDLDLEVQFTNVIDFLPTEKLCIHTGTLGSEDLGVDYWNGTGWENLATDLNAYSCNEYTVSLTSTNFTVRFKGGNETGDTTRDQWQIDASLLRVEGAGDKEDAVNNDTSDVDSSADLGNLVNFDNMKAADSTYANLTETAPGGSITYINEAEASATTGTSAQVNKPTGTAEDDFMIALLVSTIGSDTDGSTMFSAPSGWTSEHNYTQTAPSGQHVYIYWKVAGASEPSSYTWTWTSSCGWVAQISTFRGVDTTSPIHVEGTVNQETSASPMSPSVTTTVDNSMIWLYDMSDGSAVPAGGGAPSGTTWVDQTEVATPGNGLGISTAYFVQASAGGTGNQDWTLAASDENSGQQYALKPAPADYQLDQEVQWTGIPYLLPNENLSIYGGTMDSEDILVDVWNGTGWENVFTDLSSGWNNASITDWLTTSNFTIRFKGGNETGDTVQDTWQIDVALIHIWHDGGENYEVDLEVQWTSADYTRTNEELRIRTGTFSGSENIQVKVWNSTGSSWHWVMNLTASQWNNVSITSYLTSNTLTVQLLGGTETGDTTQNSWNVDATLIYVWTVESTDYVDNNTSDVDSSADKGTHGNFSAQQYGPDSINDTLTESGGGGGTVWLWQEDTSGYTSTSSFETYEFWNSWTTNSTTSGTVTKIGIYVFADPGNSPQVKLGIYDDSGGSPNNLLGETNATTMTGAGWLDLEINGSGVSISASTTYHVAHITDIAPTTQWRYSKVATPVSDYRNNRVWDNMFDPAGATAKSGSYRYDAYRVGYDEPTNYRLDLEVQWTTDYTTYDELCIKTGTFNGSEDIIVYAWNVSASDWHALYNLTASSWNNVSVTDWFFNENFTVRFLGGNETSDTAQDSWNIDVSFLQAWTSNSTYDYVLRVNNTVTDSWQIRLKKYSDSNINRLRNCTIYFHNSTDGTSSQIVIENGVYTQDVGSWYDLGDSETIYIAVATEASVSGTSNINVYLEILTPGTTTYAQYILVFQFT